MKEVVWGMIGTGDVTEKKSGPGLYKAEGSRLKAVYNRTKERAESWTQRHGHGVVYESAEEIMKDSEITAVYIATPPSSHFDYAMQVIKAGKIPFIEKPMASTYEECRQIIDAADKKNIPVYVSFYRRAIDKFQKIHTLLEEGAIGKPILAEIRQFQPPQKEELQKESLPWRLTPEAGGGKALDVQVHVLDYLAFYFGDIQEMKGIVDNQGDLYSVEDTISASFQFKNGVVGSATWSYVADFFLDEVTIMGTKGRLVFAGMNFDSVTLIKKEQEETYYFDSPEHVAMPLIQTIVDEIRGVAKSPADAESAANGIKMFDQLLKEYRQRY